MAIDTLRSLDTSENPIALIEWLLTIPKEAADKETPSSATPDTLSDDGKKSDDTTPDAPPAGEDGATD